MTIAIDIQEVQSGYDQKTCWVQTRAGIVPHLNKAVMTTQKLRLSGSDIFYGINAIVSDDTGKSWGKPVPQDAFKARDHENGACFYVSDFCPQWHEQTQTLLGTGHTPCYKEIENYGGNNTIFVSKVAGMSS